jgi:hypothetical protein
MHPLFVHHATAAFTVLVALGLTPPAGAQPITAKPVAAKSVAAPATRVVFFDGPPAARQPEQGVLVLNLHGLDSAEAALTMAQHWRRKLGGTTRLTCWLQGGTRGETADALGALLHADTPSCDLIQVPR